jgi:hypothetical protein
VNATPLHRAHIVLLLGLLFMIAGLVFVEKSIDYFGPGHTFENSAYERIQVLGLFLLAVSSLLIAIGAIYGSRKLVLASAAKTGTVCLTIAAAFWWVVSLEGGINTHDWTLALVIPGFVWTAAGIVLLLASCVRLLLEKARS